MLNRGWDMLINQEFLNNLSPVEVTFIRTGIEKLYKTKVTHDTTNYENLNVHVDHCPHCGSVRFIKNGFNPHHKQKYRCKDCRSVFMATTGTLFTHSKTTFDIWGTFIAGELNDLTLNAQVVATGLSRTTCFNMRHKLYKAASKIQDGSVLSGQIELDPTYTKINLKGTRPQNMPRFSKHRGKTRKPGTSQKTPGISNHKVCIVAAIDENDNMLLKIAGLGRESFDMFEKYKTSFSDTCEIISDDSHSIQTFVNRHKYQHDIIPSNANYSLNGNTVSQLNEIHQEIKELNRMKRGISTRHLQGYLNWIILRKHLRYTLDMKKWRPAAYMDVMFEQIPFICKDINKLPMPIDLYEAYGEYHYGIYSSIN